jgi:choline dehydrogenase
VHDLPGVGANLIDHYVIRVSAPRARHTDGERDRALPRVLPEILKLCLHGKGALTFGRTTAQVLLRQPRGPGLARPAAPVHAGQHASPEFRPRSTSSPA